MFTIPVEDNPLNAGAYRVLFEMTQPAFCATRERQGEIRTQFLATLEWARSQTPEILAAYRWASEQILKDIEHRLTAQDFSKRCETAYQAIPKPPSKDAGPSS